MNIQSQTDIVNRLIGIDESDIEILVGNIRAVSSGSSVLTHTQSVQLMYWNDALLMVRQGLEGLKLKLDSLMDRKSLHSTCAEVCASHPSPAPVAGLGCGAELPR